MLCMFDWTCPLRRRIVATIKNKNKICYFWRTRNDMLVILQSLSLCFCFINCSAIKIKCKQQITIIDLFTLSATYLITN